jgi:hypothetical protein
MDASAIPLHLRKRLLSEWRKILDIRIGPKVPIDCRQITSWLR